MSYKLEDLKKRKAKIEAEIQKVRSREAGAARKAETRKKILAGSMALAMVERGEWPAEKFKSAMGRYLSRPEDRSLFSLSPDSE